MSGFLDRIAAERSRPRNRRHQQQELSWPVGADVALESSAFGHSPEFPREDYADYIATSNDVFACVTLRARQMQRLKLNLFRGDGPNKQAVTKGPAVDLLRHVNPFWTWPRLARMDELSMGVWGETYWAIERNPVSGVPGEIWWLKPSRMFPVPDEDEYLSGFWYHSAAGQWLHFDTDEVVWFRYPNPRDEFSALPPLAAARLAADTAGSMMRANANLNDGGLQLGGLIVPAKDKVTFKDGQAEQLETLLAKRWSKKENAKKWAVLRYEAQFLPMSVTPKDAEFVSGLNLTLRRVANTYGIPTPLLNDLEHATLANVDSLIRWLWTGALQPDAELKSAEIVEQLLPMFSAFRHGNGLGPDNASHDFSQISELQESEEAAWGRERQAIEVGRTTINEVRKRKGEPPLPWGDVWWAPVNKSAVRDDTSTPQGDTSPTGDGTDPQGETSTPDTTQTRRPTGELIGPLGRSLIAEIDQWRLVNTGLNGKERA